MGFSIEQKLSAISRFSFQSSVVSFQFSVVSYQLPVALTRLLEIFYQHQVALVAVCLGIEDGALVCGNRDGRTRIRADGRLGEPNILELAAGVDAVYPDALRVAEIIYAAAGQRIPGGDDFGQHQLRLTPRLTTSHRQTPQPLVVFVIE